MTMSHLYVDKECAAVSTKKNFPQPHRRKHVIRTLRDMSSLGVVPIINENDTLSTQVSEIG